jgi:SSS family solute:Na+ symporter
VVLVYMLLTAGQLVAMASLLKVWVDTRLEWLLAAAALSTVVYTAFAGIKSDFYTDGVHFVVMILVFFGVLTPAVIHGGGDLGAIKRLPANYFDIFAYGGTSFFVAGIVFGIGMVFVTMEIWQRIYASSSPTAARWALISSGVVIVAFYVLSSLIGMVARALSLPVTNPDLALFVAMKQFLPSGLLGLGLAAFLAVIISTVNSLLMVVSATLTKDFYQPLVRPQASDAQMLRAGRAITFVVGVLAFGIAVRFQSVVVLTVNSMFILLVLVPAIMGGFFWRRSTSKGCFLSIAVGVVVTLVVAVFRPNEAFVPGFLGSLLVFVIVSRFTDHSPNEIVELLANRKA